MTLSRPGVRERHWRKTALLFSWIGIGLILVDQIHEAHGACAGGRGAFGETIDEMDWSKLLAAPLLVNINEHQRNAVTISAAAFAVSLSLSAQIFQTRCDFCPGDFKTVNLKSQGKRYYIQLTENEPTHCQRTAQNLVLRNDYPRYL